VRFEVLPLLPARPGSPPCPDRHHDRGSR